ncbi:signal peptidase I [Lamprobacter modestohalophilus]|uniref:signal peptidase I n=1 Tax=Lamprobacter modestohalophilus TaxID=1064514 RepID=UPI002ADEE8A7|nr:signal peptidase I [Lamprobacter modestohalophilus]MEA1051699.1 signal peptidase I [Lamprobacter modestohalophilus]
MSFDFPTFLVAATFLTGGVWLLDVLLWAPKRRRLAAASGSGSDESAQGAVTGYKEPVLVEYARSFFPVILVVLLLRSFVVEPFRIPSGSMMPTLLVGDFILVNKFSYGLRLPVLNTKFVELGEPERGDVMVFRFPRDESVDYIKRVIALPGDQVYYRDKTIYVNGEPLEQVPLGDYIDENGRPTGLIEAVEEVGDEREHEILINPRTGDFPRSCGVLARGPVTVPEGMYFVMGDNRDNSNDGRCWGFVPEENLVGKAFAIWMSWDGNRDGFPIAFGRIGNVIH